MARKVPKSLFSWIMPKLRRLSMYWPSKNIARDLAKVKVQVGKTKNGYPIMRVFYKCAECERQGIKKFYTRKETQADHIIPCVDISGFTTWDEYMERLFAKPEEYQIICLQHHKEKTLNENKKRNKYVKNNKK